MSWSYQATVCQFFLASFFHQAFKNSPKCRNESWINKCVLNCARHERTQCIHMLLSFEWHFQLLFDIISEETQSFTLGTVRPDTQLSILHSLSEDWNCSTLHKSETICRHSSISTFDRQKNRVCNFSHCDWVITSSRSSSIFVSYNWIRKILILYKSLVLAQS